MVTSENYSSWKTDHPILWKAGMAILVSVGIIALLLIAVLGLILAQSGVGQALSLFASWLFAIQTVQSLWYVTRAAGIVAYLLLWLSMVWGLAVPAKIFDNVLQRAFTFEYHQFLSLLAVGFIFLHVAVLLADQYLPFTVAQVLVPFIAPYRPAWVGIGVLGFYLILLVTITFYLRSRIGMRAFRLIHVLSLLSYLGALVHSFFSGTDSTLPAAQIMYASTFLVVVFLTAYWIFIGEGKKALMESRKTRLPEKSKTA
ncbi:MAG: hypothetical protein ACM3PY_19560 [Omnitrophica WOR_2 bacterium]